jgi:hypothetical protein
MSASIESMFQQAEQQFRALQRSTRKVEKERIALGKLLIRIRKALSVENNHGGFRGSHKGVFCKRLRTLGMNVGQCYWYIRLAEGGQDMSAMPSRKRSVYWAKFARQIKKASPSEKVTLLRHAVAYLVKEYGIDARVTVRPASNYRAGIAARTVSKARAAAA